MTSSTKKEKESSPSSADDAPSSSRSSKRNNKERDSSKAKEKTRRARDHPATTPGAVPSSSSSNRLERKKESSSGGKTRSSSASVDKSPGGRKSRSSSVASKPGAVSSTGRDRSGKGGSSRSSKKTSHRTSKASSGSSTSRSSRPSEEKQVHLATIKSDRGPSVAPSANEMETGLVAEAVDDTAAQTTTNALREKNRENEALRQELQRRDEEQASQSRRRGKPFWGKVCLGSLILIGAIIGAVIAFGSDEAATIVNPTDPSSEPTTQATTTGPDDQTVFDPPSSGTCSKISEGLDVDDQDKMTMQPLTIKMTVNLLVDIRSELWLPDMLQKVQQLVMPPIVGCGNTTLDVFTIGNAQVDQSNATLVSCEDQTNGPCYTVEFPVNLFMKQDVVSYDLMELNQRVEGMFQISTSLMVDSENENSKAIKDIGSVTSVPVTPSPSQQPSTTVILTSPPSPLPSLEPTMALTSGATASPTTTLLSTPGPTASPTTLPTPGPTVTPASGPTLAPTLVPSVGPTMSPTAGPTLAPVPGLTPPPSPIPTPGPTAAPSPPPTPGPTIAPTPDPTDSPSRTPSRSPSGQPSTAPTSKCTRLEATLSRFTPFDGNKAQALDWLCSDDTWEPPADATDETSQSLWEERFVLAAFYYATNGDGWSNNDGWLSSASVCSWTGIIGCNGDESVTNFQLMINAVNYGLVGTLPDEMRALTNLEHMDFKFNLGIGGTIPSFLTELTKLTYLNNAGCGHTGSIPSELWTLTRLRGLFLSGNNLTGTIPPGLSALTDLVDLRIEYMYLVGQLPDEFSGLGSLTKLLLQENFLTGTIPPLPPNLISCALANDPADWIYFASRKTEGNCFTDTTNAPSGFCNLSANQCQLEATLSRFAPFDGNKALALDWLKSDTWEPPSSAMDETSQSLLEERFALAVFYYATTGDNWNNNDGWLTSASVCSWIGIDGCNGDGSVTKIQLWDQRGRSYGLVGDFPDEMRALSNLEHFWFAYNRYLSGTIPSFLTSMTKMTRLVLGDTGRIGSIPSELWTLTQLQGQLSLFGNYLTGTIPPGFSALTEVDNISLFCNDLTGTLPDELEGMTQLTTIGFNENFLSGTIPPLPSGLTQCHLAHEGGNWIHYIGRKTEGNCFTDTTNAPGFCYLNTNCP